MNPKKILNANELSTILHRLSYQLIEDHNDFSNTVLIGIQPRGPILATRLLQLLNDNDNINLGFLDITFFRDDFRRNEKSLKASTTSLDFVIEGKTVILIDDVLFTGRSIRAALDAIQSYGRPKSIQLLTLIDRRFSRELPIQPDYCGIQVDSRLNEKVKVNWNENDGEDSVYLIKNK
jgi:pyrimidine operon attenuation protein/uracil phosphoribosyltransferase